MPSLPTRRTQVVLLQHPRERRNGIGTARMAHLSLPGSVLRAGLDFAADPVVTPLLCGPQAYVLFPGPDSVPAEAVPSGQPITLIVLDGTWWQASKLLKLNPALQKLPRIGFAPTNPSTYRIRRQPAPHCVSTIEALAEILGVLEGDAVDYRRLLMPFHEMVARQVRFETEVNQQRHQRNRRLRPHRPQLPEQLHTLWDRLVLVQAEANVWPLHSKPRPPAEIVHWLACRPATGARLDLIVSPRQPLAPKIPGYVELDSETLSQGQTAADARTAWSRFLRPDDVVCAFGLYHLTVAHADGWPLPPQTMDLRNQLSQFLHRRLGTIEDAANHLELPLPQPTTPGRASRRMALLMALVQAIKARARVELRNGG